jgi:hypothetical protein
VTQALIIEPDGTIDVRSVISDAWTRATVIHDLVGGYFTIVTGPGWHIYFNEDGHQMGLPNNAVATRLAAQFHRFIPDDELVGTVVVFGNARNDGDADVPPQVVALARRLAADVHTR